MPTLKEIEVIFKDASDDYDENNSTEESEQELDFNEVNNHE